jgi:hypothetical protein
MELNTVMQTPRIASYRAIQRTLFAFSRENTTPREPLKSHWPFRRAPRSRFGRFDQFDPRRSNGGYRRKADILVIPTDGCFPPNPSVHGPERNDRFTSAPCRPVRLRSAGMGLPRRFSTIGVQVQRAINRRMPGRRHAKFVAEHVHAPG